MPTCPDCKGKKTQDITAQELKVVDGKRAFVDMPVVTIPCLMCHGTGSVTQEEIDKAEKENEIWCHCNGDVSASIYKADGECMCGVVKHHYHCPDCGKITQIG
jgi:hypothetical protein